MDASVALRGGGNVGKISDFVVSPDGQIEYAVVAYEDRYVLVPWSALRVDSGDRGLHVDVTRERWREVPTFTRERWPDFSDPNYTQRVYRFFGMERGPARGGVDSRVPPGAPRGVDPRVPPGTPRGGNPPVPPGLPRGGIPPVPPGAPPGR